jgi:hypothetical protein
LFGFGTKPTFLILSLQFYKGEPAMEKAFFLNTTNPDYTKYFRAYKRLLLESILILSQGSPTVSSDVEEILEFETKFAKVCSHSHSIELNAIECCI